MKAAYKAILIILFLAAIPAGKEALAQSCTGSVPHFTIDMSSKADSVWTSSSVTRAGQCCSFSSSFRCIHFTVTLAPGAMGVVVDVSGSSSYTVQDNCSGSSADGDTICLTGGTTHELTICKSGSSGSNTYTIRSIAAPVVYAGADTSICSAANSISLNGSVSGAASSWNWSGGTGRFFSSSTSLTNTYVPSQAEISAGYVNLILRATGTSQTCTTVRDTLRATIYSAPVPVISGNTQVCEKSSNEVYSVTAQTGHSYDWHLVGGTITSGQGTNSVNVKWDTAAPGYIYMVETDTNGCQGVGAINTLSRFDFSGGPLTQATTGPNATSSDTDAYSNGLGYQITSNCGGSKGIDLTIPGSIFDRGKMCMTFSWQRDENDADFFTRGGTTYGIRGGVLQVGLRISNGAGGYTDIGPLSTGYTVPNDNVFRYFTFCYDSATGSGRLMVHDSLVWSYQGTAGRSLYWTGAGDVYIGQIMDGACNGRTLLDWSNISVPISVISRPKANLFGPTTMCQNKAGLYYTTTGKSYYRYTWTVTGGTALGNTNNDSVWILWTSPGTRSVTMRQTDSINGCDSAVSLSVTVNAAPAPVITGSDTVCIGALKQYTAPTSATASYLWSTTGGLITGGTTNDTIGLTFSAGGLYTLTLKMTNSPSGCDSTVTKTIYVDTVPTAAISGLTPVCKGSTQPYTTTSNSKYSYSWSTTLGTIASGQGTSGASIKWTGSGTATISVTVTKSPGNCTATATKSVTVNAPPTPTITGADTACPSVLKQYIAPVVSGTTYLWSTTAGTISGGTGNDTIGLTFSTGGIATLTLKMTNNTTGCDSTVTKTIYVDTIPTAAITGLSPVCQGTTQTYQTTSNSKYSYSWSTTMGTVATGQGTNSASISWPYTTGTPTVSVTVTKSPGNCTTTATKSVIINAPPTPTITGADTACPAVQKQYTAPVVANTSYLWSSPSGTITGGATNDTIGLTFSTGGVYTLSLKMTNNTTGCDSTITKTIYVDTIPTAAITGPTPVCQGTTQTYQTTPNSKYSYSWGTTMGTITTGQGTDAASIRWPYTTGTATVSVTVTKSPGNCTATATKSVTVSAPPTPTITGADTACPTVQKQYTAPVVANTSYLWTSPSGTITGGATNDTIGLTFSTGGIYTLSLKMTNNTTGCDSTVTKSIYVDTIPVALITGPSPVCQGATELYQTPLNSKYSYTWATTLGSIATGQGTNAVSINWIAAGTANVSVTVVKAPAGCTTTAEKTVIVRPMPSAITIGHN